MKFKAVLSEIVKRKSPFHFIRLMIAFAVFGIFIVSFSGCNKNDSSSNLSSSSGSSSTSGTYFQSSGIVSLASKNYVSSTDDSSAVEVTGGTLYISGSTISSTGNTSSNDSSSFYGQNAVILASTSSGTAVINSSDDTITSSGTGANGIFAYGTAEITSEGDNLTMTGDGGHALMCSGGGTLTIKNDTAVTSGASASTIATDRGGGTIKVTGGTYTSNGQNSAAVYSTGTITCTGATLTSNGAEALVIEGSNLIALNNCIIKCTFNKWGSLLYQSMSGDASGAVGTLDITGGSFTYTGTAGGMFYNTNSTAYITLDNVKLSNNCDTLVRCIKGSWGGSSASSGGIVYFTAEDQTMSGMIYVDSNSEAYINLANFSTFSGSIDPSRTASILTLTMDVGSTWTVTKDSYINGAISDPGIAGTSVSNIIGNGNNVYYNSSANSALNAATYSLVNGGQLIPY